MPDVLNKQAIVNLLIDSPLREPIKINLIDIVNNTAEADLPKVYSTITKELEIFQKATERRMKLAEETIAKLSGVTPTELAPSADTPTPAPMNNPMPTPPAPSAPMTPPLEMPSPGLAATPLDLPPVSEMPKLEPAMPNDTATMPSETPAVAPVMPVTPPAPMPNFQPLGGAPVNSSTDEEALAEIQKELDSLKTSTAAEVASTAAATTAPTPAPAK